MKNLIEVNRNLVDDPIIRDPVLFHLFFYLLLKANKCDSEEVKGGNRVSVSRGEVLTSRALITEETHIKPSTVYTRLKHLVATGYISVKSSNRYTLVTIKNFNKIVR